MANLLLDPIFYCSIYKICIWLKLIKNYIYSKIKYPACHNKDKVIVLDRFAYVEKEVNFFQIFVNRIQILSKSRINSLINTLKQHLK